VEEDLDDDILFAIQNLWLNDISSKVREYFWLAVVIS
jgi:hypothetical protein